MAKGPQREAYVLCKCDKCLMDGKGTMVDQVHWMRHNNLLTSAVSKHCVSVWGRREKEE